MTAARLAELERRVAALEARVGVAEPSPLARRIELLTEARKQFYPGHSDAEAAEAIATAWRRYDAGGWRREWDLEACPAHRQGRLEGLLWAMMKIRPRVLSARQVRRLLATLAISNGQDGRS